MFNFRKIRRALFSWNTRFEIHPFALLPTYGVYRMGYFVWLTQNLRFSYKGFFCKVEHLSILTKLTLKGKLYFLEYVLWKSIVEKTRKCWRYVIWTLSSINSVVSRIKLNPTMFINSVVSRIKSNPTRLW